MVGLEVLHFSEKIVMRRASEASLFLLGFPRKKKPLHNGSYERRVNKKKKKHFSVPGMFVCVCVIVYLCDSVFV